jgi:hypothetical protein
MMLANGIGCILIPAFRGVGIMLTYANISRCNSVRRAHAAALLQLTADMARKLKASAGLGPETRAIREEDVHYTTALTLEEQSAQHDPHREAWDAALLKKHET